MILPLDLRKIHDFDVLGRFQVGNLDRVSLDDFAKTMAINVEGPLFMTKEIGPSP